MGLEKLLGEELFKQVTEKIGDTKIDIVSDGQWIPKAKFDEINGEKNTYKEQLGTMEKELDKLKGTLKDNEGADEIIEQLKGQIKERETEISNVRKANAIKLRVLQANPKDINDILPHIDDSMVKVEDDKVIGMEYVENQLKEMEKDKAYLFKEELPAGTGGSKGAGEKNRQDPAEPNLGTEIGKKAKKPEVDLSIYKL